ncbi:permease [Candidatus Poribacteria bacterium]|nr:permease [Candidatus Poribacteria bacterium]
MLLPTLVMAALAVVLVFVGYRNGTNQHIAGAKLAGNMLLSILPLLVFAFLVAGMMQVLIPRELLSKWIGAESGWRGILIGTVVGGFMPGGPYVSLPVVLGLLKAGASVGTSVALLTSWSLWAVARLPMEIGILGWRFTLVRFVSTFAFPPIAGWLAQAVFGNFRVT